MKKMNDFDATRPQNDDDGDEDDTPHALVQQQASLVRQQDEQLVLISGSVGALKNMSREIGSELDQQALYVCIFSP